MIALEMARRCALIWWLRAPAVVGCEVFSYER